MEDSMIPTLTKEGEARLAILETVVSEVTEKAEKVAEELRTLEERRDNLQDEVKRIRAYLSVLRDEPGKQPRRRGREAVTEEVLELLRKEGGGLATAEIAKRLKRSERTVERAVETLQDTGTLSANTGTIIE